MTDHELLERAAKAAGIAVRLHGDGGLYRVERGVFTLPWNPLTDDGDAFRLAVKLGLAICDWRQYERACVDTEDGKEYWEPVGTDPYAATRRAIVRAAAAMAPTGEPTPNSIFGVTRPNIRVVKWPDLDAEPGAPTGEKP
jgi:hypothetical protein